MGFSFALYRNDAERVHDLPQMAYRITLPELAGRQLQLRYRPAADNDARVLADLLPEARDLGIPLTELPRRLPGYRVQLIAELRLDDRVVAAAGPYTLGQPLVSLTTIDRLSAGEARAINQPTAGEWLYFAVDSGGIPSEDLIGSVANRPDNAFPSMARTWFASADQSLNTLSILGLGVGFRHPSFGTFSTNLQTEFVFGLPRNVELAGVRVDMDYIGETVVPLDGGGPDEAELREALGIVASALEHEVPALFLSNSTIPASSVSAVRALGLAVQQGQLLRAVDASNVDVALTGLTLSTETLEDLRFAIARGDVALLSPGPIQSGAWRGEGYVLIDPQTGAGAYRIRGGSNGGAAQSEIDASLAMVGLGYLVGFVVPPAYAHEGSCGQSDSGNSNIRVSWVDILLVVGLIALLFSIGAALPPAGVVVARALGVLLAYFLPMFSRIANADGVGCPKYISGYQTHRGKPMYEVTRHIADAIGEGKPTELVYQGGRSLRALNVEAGDDSFDARWYNATTICSEKRRQDERDERGISLQCDEYPFFSTFQGGYESYLTGGVSLRLVDAAHNNAQGGTLGRFYALCGVVMGSPFEVEANTSVDSVTHGLDRDGNQCFPER